MHLWIFKIARNIYFKDSLKFHQYNIYALNNCKNVLRGLKTNECVFELLPYILYSSLFV